MKNIDYGNPKNLDKITFIVNKNKKLIEETEFIRRKRLVSVLYRNYYKNDGIYSDSREYQ